MRSSVVAPVIYFEPPPAASELPTTFASPFAHGTPSPLARRAADELIAGLRAGAFAIDAAALDAPGGGKMFGVLVVADADGRVGYLRGFSGMLGGSWDVDGFVPAAFDARVRDAVWPAGERELAVRAAEIVAIADGDELRAARDALATLSARHAAVDAAMSARHAANRVARHAARAVLAAGDSAGMHALDQASRADTAERRRLDAAHAGACAPIAERVRSLDEQRVALEAARAARSRELLLQIYDSYVLANAHGERRAMRALFAPDVPPGGAGDCAAPKLLAHAYRLGVRPLALAELWLGTPPATGGRHAGVFYPACRSKCGVILPFMLDGVAVEAAPVFGRAAGGRVGDDEPRVVFEDRWMVVVDKPCGLLSVPGRSGLLRDSVQTRMRARYPEATGPLVVHRLDLETSGLLVVAKDAATHVALQRLFARREIDKRYVALVVGDVHGDAGTISLSVRGDLEDRPRQIVDVVDGKPAVTEWRVVARDGAAARTRVELVPRTGRTHQLRVHAAHRDGLDAAIVGDRLYGAQDVGEGERMMLHAERIAFVHPWTGERVEIEASAPF